MKEVVVCAVCGKKGKVSINDDTYAILGNNFFYFGKLKSGGKLVDYWECSDCYQKKE